MICRLACSVPPANARPTRSFGNNLLDEERPTLICDLQPQSSALSRRFGDKPAMWMFPTGHAPDRSCETMPQCRSLSRAPLGGKTNVTVTVNGKPWQFVSGLADSGPRDRDFTVSQTTDGKTAITFGDGVHGALPPAGSEITVHYNGGGGTGGTGSP